MKTIRLYFLFFTLSAGHLFAADITVGTWTFSGNPSDGDTITANAVVRTFKTTVTTPATQIEIGADAAATIAEAVNQISANPFTGLFVSGYTATTLEIRNSIPGTALVGSESSTSISYADATLSFTTMRTIRVPQSGEDAGVRTNLMTLLVTGIQDYAQAPFDQSNTALSEYVSLQGAQSVSNKVMWLSTFASPITTNLVNNGNAITSAGSGTGSEQFGTSADASGDYSLSVGYSSGATGNFSTAVGYGAAADGLESFAGGPAEAIGSKSIAIGSGSEASDINSIALGVLSNSSYENSIALGNGVSTTADDQIRIGVTAHDVVIPGTLVVTSGITNTVVNATTLYIGASSGDNEHTGEWAYVMGTHTGMANGNNASVDFSGSVFWRIDAGPTAAFSICGIAAGGDGDMIVLHNNTGFNMTVANDSGVDATAANRIYTMTGSDVVSTTRCSATLLYDSNLSRWILTNFQD